jgi:hypothetical protein
LVTISTTISSTMTVVTIPNTVERLAAAR